MCTLSIVKTNNKIIVTMNRDERRQRHESEILSEIQSESGTRTIFPTDVQSGGSWFGFNDSGIVLALLNRYQDPLKADAVSRGEIIPRALAWGSFDEVFDYCGRLKVEKYNPFDLMMISFEGCYCFKWDGKDFNIMPISIDQGYMKTSSSVDMASVLKWRSEFFDGWLSQQPDSNFAKKDLLTQFHFIQIEEDKSRSILMSREHSHTKSISQLSISSSELNFQYYPESALTELNTRPDYIPANFQTALLPLQR